MILYGQYDSPFVRRVAVTLHIYGISYDRQIYSVFGDFGKAMAANPLGQVPALTLDDGEVLFDSQMILDHLDEYVGPDKALTPAAGPERRAVLRRVTVALGLADKAVGLRGELFRRAPGTIDPACVERLESQILSALSWLERGGLSPEISAEPWRQDDITTAVVYTFLANKLPDLLARADTPSLATLAQACEATPAFKTAVFQEG